MSDATQSGPVITGAALVETTAAWTSATAGNTALQLNVGNFGTAIITLNQGTTITGGVITFEVSDTTAFTNAYPVVAIDSGDGQQTLAYTLVASTNVSFRVNVAGWLAVRARLSTAITGTATVNVGIEAQALPVATHVAANPPVSTTLNSNGVSATTTASQLIAANPKRRSFRITNAETIASHICYLGGSNAVTSANGFAVLSSTTTPPFTSYTGAVWVIMGTSTGAISYAEESA